MYGMLGLGMDASTASTFAPEQSLAADGKLESFLAEDLSGLEVTRVLVQGNPEREIVKYAHSLEFGLIVLPTHGYGPFRQFLLGSVTAKVLHDADCPVLTGVHMENGPWAESPNLQKVLCAIDLGSQSSKTLSWASEFTRKIGGELTIVHVVPDGRSDFFGNWQPILEKQAREEIRRLQKTLEVPAQVCIEIGEFPAMISQAAGRLKSDLLIIGRGIAANVFGRLRTYSYAIIRQSPCPVVSV
jgi:nucleotide-binding universal stress UspA family protein